jgi:hypothetical protein
VGVTSELWCREVPLREDVPHAQALSPGVPRGRDPGCPQRRAWRPDQGRRCRLRDHRVLFDPSSALGGPAFRPSSRSARARSPSRSRRNRERSDSLGHRQARVVPPQPLEEVGHLVIGPHRRRPPLEVGVTTRSQPPPPSRAAAATTTTTDHAAPLVIRSMKTTRSATKSSSCAASSSIRSRTSSGSSMDRTSSLARPSSVWTITVPSRTS